MTDVISSNFFGTDIALQSCWNNSTFQFYTRAWILSQTQPFGYHFYTHLTYKNLKHVSDIGFFFTGRRMLTLPFLMLTLNLPFLLLRATKKKELKTNKKYRSNINDCSRIIKYLKRTKKIMHQFICLFIHMFLSISFVAKSVSLCEQGLPYG